MGYDELRRNDYSLEDHQEAVVKAFRDFFRTECPTSLVRDSEDSGFAAGLWKRALQMGLVSMGLPRDSGGDGASLVDLALVAESAGEVLSPIPLVSHLVASRTLARAGAPRGIADVALAGDRIFTLALLTASDSEQLVPDAAISRDVLAFDGIELRMHTGPQSAAVRNHAGTAIGWWSPRRADGRLTLSTGAEAASGFRRACDEWRVLTGAMLVGLAERALSIGVEFSKTRNTMGVPIGSLQGVAFPLADAAIGIAGARHLVRKSAWMLENAADDQPELPLIAFSYAREAAAEAAATAVHVQGGMGVSLEADVTLYFNRAIAWPAPAGRVVDDYVEIATAFTSRIS